ncbi:MAG: 23S rRNA (guanosine(2251)-2'-O)-methyltransferase RlmB [Myxococcota bacterium]
MSRRGQGHVRDRRRARTSEGNQGGSENIVVGRHAVMSALHEVPEIAQRLYLLSGGKGLEDLTQLARGLGIIVESESRDALDVRAGGVMHQGAVLTIRGFPYADLEEAIEAADPTEALFVVLDGVEDPRNLGAAARAAHAFGATALVIPKDRAAGVTASAHKTAAGALFRLQVARVDNLRRALDELREAGFWIYGAEADGGVAPWSVDLRGRICLVIGGEDRGVRRLSRDACDGMLAIPMAAEDVSLNAADAATVLLYEVVRQRAIAPGASA